jgi:hypothetical protein
LFTSVDTQGFGRGKGEVSMHRSSVQCVECGERIEAAAENLYQEICIDAVMDLKAHIHYKKHGKKYLKNKGIAKRIGFVSLICVAYIVLVPVWLITWPFAKLHELVSG